ncbi:MAG: hypothetical protein IPQ13_04270 [Holophagaceae bacterium]|nr:hypothetical protein [Holophagaceae bacterium]
MDQFLTLLLVLVPLSIVILLVVALVAIRKNHNQKSIQGLTDENGQITNSLIIRLLSILLACLGTVGILACIILNFNTPYGFIQVLAPSLILFGTGVAGLWRNQVGGKSER